MNATNHAILQSLVSTAPVLPGPLGRVHWEEGLGQPGGQWECLLRSRSSLSVEPLLLRARVVRFPHMCRCWSLWGHTMCRLCRCTHICTHMHMETCRYGWWNPDS